MKKIGLLFAGQGAQTVGMGRDLVEQFPTAADLFQKADDVLGRKLTEIAWNGPIEDLTKTSNCQPALFVHGLAESGEAWRAWVPLLSRDYRVIRYDQPGLGRSSPVDGIDAFSTQRFVDAAAAVIEQERKRIADFTATLAKIDDQLKRLG